MDLTVHHTRNENSPSRSNEAMKHMRSTAVGMSELNSIGSWRYSIPATALKEKIQAVANESISLELIHDGIWVQPKPEGKQSKQ